MSIRSHHTHGTVHLHWINVFFLHSQFDLCVFFSPFILFCLFILVRSLNITKSELCKKRQWHTTAKINYVIDDSISISISITVLLLLFSSWIVDSFIKSQMTFSFGIFLCYKSFCCIIFDSVNWLLSNFSRVDWSSTRRANRKKPSPFVRMYNTDALENEHSNGLISLCAETSNKED